MLVSDGAASLVDIARQARLYASSCKEGHRVEAVLDRNGETYWQSEGQLPHWIQLEFSSRRTIVKIELDVWQSSDDSYCPLSIVLLAGESPFGLLDVLSMTVVKDSRTVVLDIVEANDSLPIDVFCLRVLIVANHSNGKDSRIRGVRVYGRALDPWAIDLL